MVVPHGVVVPPELRWNGEMDRGITVVNGIERRGRLAGFDIFLRLRERIPVDLAGMGSENFDGLGDLPLRTLHETETRYRFFFNPIRYTSMPLSVVEAMALGLPIVALATTELPRAVPHGEAGFVSNDLDELEDGMRRLLADPGLARRMGQRSKEVAREQFGIERFVCDWERAFRRALGEDARTCAA
jgi:glycosyltransferase involved in cell wall biosynthesis